MIKKQTLVEKRDVLLFEILEEFKKLNDNLAIILGDKKGKNDSVHHLSENKDKPIKIAKNKTNEVKKDGIRKSNSTRKR